MSNDYACAGDVQYIDILYSGDSIHICLIEVQNKSINEERKPWLED